MTRDGVHLAVGAVLADTRSQEQDAGQGRPATDRVDLCGPREVEEVELRGQPATTPYPVSDHRINDDGHQKAEHDERVILDALSHGAGDDRGGGASKYQL